MSIATDYMGKIILMVIVVIVAIMLVNDFYMKSREATNNIIPHTDESGSIVAERVNLTDAGILSEKDIEKYCRLCQAAVEKYDPPDDAVCYILKGDFMPSSFPTDVCGRWICDDWITATNVIISYNWRKSTVQVEC